MAIASVATDFVSEDQVLGQHWCLTSRQIVSLQLVN